MKYEESVTKAIVAHEISHLAYSGIGVYNLTLHKVAIEQQINHFVAHNQSISTEEIYDTLLNYVNSNEIRENPTAHLIDTAKEK